MRALGHWPELPRIAGRHRGTWDTGLKRPGELVHPRPSNPSTTLLGELVNHTGPRFRARVAQESWSTPRAPRPWPKMLRTAGRPLRTLEPGMSRAGQLVDTAGTRTPPESPRYAGRPHGTTEPSRVTRDSLSNLRALGHECEAPRTAVRHRGPTETGPSRQGHRGISELGASPPGELVDLAGYWSWAGVARERWSTPRALRPERESSRTAGRTRRPTTRARVA